MRHLSVAVDLVWRDAGLGAEKRDQPLKRCELLVGRAGVLEIADQTNADAVLVEIVAGTPGT